MPNKNNAIQELIEEITNNSDLVSAPPIPKKLAPKRKHSSSKCNTAHKYLRFNSNNKTYRIDTYYCINCPSTLSIDRIIGRTVLCWKCNKEFKIELAYFANKPVCRDCRGKKNKEKEAILDEILRGVV